MLQKNRILLGVACIVLLLLLSGVTTSNNRYHSHQDIVGENSEVYTANNDRIDSYSPAEHSISPTIDSISRQSKSFVLSGTPHDPILIVNDTDFADQAANEGWSGDGSSSTPYLIEDYLINGSAGNGIEIIDTTVYFVIHSCELINLSTSWNPSGQRHSW